VSPDIWFKGLPPKSHQVYLKTSKKGVDWLIDLTFSNMSPSLVKGDGVSKVGKKKVGQVIHIPQGRVSGVIAINGDTVKVSGSVSMAHAWQDELATEIVTQGFQWKTGNSKKGTTGYVLATSKKEPVGYVIEMAAGVPNYVEMTSLKVEKSKKYSGVKWWQKWSYGNETKMTNVEIQSPWQKLSVLAEFSGFTKWAVEKFMGGEIVNYRGQIVVEGQKGTYNAFYIK
jgi:predicted secreted hydrolase